MNHYQQQIHAYTNLFNAINHDNPKIENLFTDLDDGLALINFIENITGIQFENVIRSPTTKNEEEQNLSIFQSLFIEKSIPLKFKIEDIQNHNEKTIMMIINSLIIIFIFKGKQHNILNFNNWGSRILDRKVDFTVEIRDENIWKDVINYLIGKVCITNEMFDGMT